VLPNLLVIGSRRCGTTSLHRYLDTHPDVWMSPQKELRFFVAERNWPRGREWYEGRFPEAAAVRGESSPCYSEYPMHPGVPARIAALLPDVRLLYVVRDPIERMVSHWVMDHALGWPHRSFSEEVADLEHSRFALAGRYWVQLERYLEHFPAERIRVIDRDALETDRSSLMAGLFGFLGLDPARAPAEAFAAEHNARRRRRLRSPVAAARRRVWAVAGERRVAAIRRALPTPLRRALSTPVREPALDAGARERLAAYYAADVARLREFTGQAFAGWTV
jgi:hypothetical protein